MNNDCKKPNQQNGNGCNTGCNTPRDPQNTNEDKSKRPEANEDRSRNQGPQDSEKSEEYSSGEFLEEESGF